MKKTIIFTALAAVLFSCGKEKVERADEGMAIGFAPRSSVGEFTRGDMITDAAGVANAGGFDVWTYSHTGLWATASDKIIIVDNAGGYAKVESPDGNTWDYGTLQPWPYGKSVSAFAYAPSGAATAINISGSKVPEISYAVPAVDQQVDLMIAEQRTDLSPNMAPVVNGRIPETFHHALSHIQLFALWSTDTTDDIYPGDEVVVKNAELRNLYYSGTAPMQTPVLWAPDKLLVKNYTFPDDLALAEGVAKSIVPAGKLMFLMPQDLNRTDVKMALTFTVNGFERTWEGLFPMPALWEAGKIYKYTFVIEGDMVAIICGDLKNPVDGGTWGNW